MTVTPVLAVFVDGTGKTRDIVLEQCYPQFYFPVPRPMSVSVLDESLATSIAYPKTTFQHIGRLSDQRVVYGQVEARLTLWTFDIDVSYQAQERTTFDIAYYECGQWMKQGSGRPVLVLFRKVRSDDQLCLHRHHFEGIGRQMPAPEGGR